jgi:hypothetical protein
MNGASKLLLLLLFCYIGSITAQSGTSSNSLSPMENATIALFHDAAPSVVHVTVEKRSESKKVDDGEYGSGFIWAGRVILSLIRMSFVMRDQSVLCCPKVGW